MGKAVEQKSWLKAVADAAKERGLDLPPFLSQGMGTARTANVTGGRFATFKRRLVPADQAANDGVEWTLWLEQGSSLAPIAAFRQPLTPGPDDVANTLCFLKGWLLDGWTREEAKSKIDAYPRRVSS